MSESDIAQLLRENADLDAAEGGNPDVVALEWAAADVIDHLLRGADDMQRALGDCRDAFPAPEQGSDLEQLWADAMADPLAVPAYVKAWAARYAKPGCNCATCRPHSVEMRMILCEVCGDKRCPHAADHRNECVVTGPQKGGSNA